jgi:hypothetical protein
LDMNLFFVHIHTLEYGIHFYFHILPSTNSNILFLFFQKKEKKRKEKFLFYFNK